LNTINKMSKKEALTTLLKVAKLQEKLIKKLSFMRMPVPKYCAQCGADIELGSFEIMDDGKIFCTDCAEGDSEDSSDED